MRNDGAFPYIPWTPHLLLKTNENKVGFPLFLTLTVGSNPVTPYPNPKLTLGITSSLYFT